MGPQELLVIPEWQRLDMDLQIDTRLDSRVVVSPLFWRSHTADDRLTRGVVVGAGVGA
jgi:hypothetical protein